MRIASGGPYTRRKREKERVRGERERGERGREREKREETTVSAKRSCLLLRTRLDVGVGDLADDNRVCGMSVQNKEHQYAQTVQTADRKKKKKKKKERSKFTLQ